MESPEINPAFLKLQQLFKAKTDVPSLPVTSIKLHELLDDPNATFGQIRSVVELDPGLSGRILKLARSAQYARGHTIVNIEQALQRIGLKNVRRAAMAMEIIENLKLGYQRFVNWNGFWYHSLLVAQLMEKFEASYYPGQGSIGFLGGMLHDVGKLFMAKYFTEQMTFIHSLSGDFREVPGSESEILGFNHAVASSMLCDQWGLPDVLSHAIQFHHEPLRRESCDDCLFCLMLACCDSLANLTGINLTPVEFTWEEFQEYPPWVALQQIPSPSPLEFELDEEAQKAQEMVNQIAGDSVVEE